MQEEGDTYARLGLSVQVVVAVSVKVVVLDVVLVNFSLFLFAAIIHLLLLVIEHRHWVAPVYTEVRHDGRVLMPVGAISVDEEMERKVENDN